ncbi:hypothetical protein K458DRAFT_421641 [Lentithecium fluviatile CBS 122367]|uniref:DUF1772-domain-containing protein n=1 Tax=Lentithecium fluviatile CBS 122367 TaxID=1168545 RepID=A0A6G1IQ87_9PLEO|nr:hypothetical protein K458DRAFT_421641 [Lentithecium fluviatile CBS 122367]
MATLFSERPPASFLIAQAVGITASTYLLGTNASLSFISVPALMMAPAPLAARQWKKVFDTGKTIGISLSIVSALSTAYVAYHQDTSSLPFKLNLAATILFPSIVPFTIFVIGPINDKLMEKAQSLASSSLEDKGVEAGVTSSETVNALLDKWATRNLARAAITGLGAIFALWAALDKREAVGASGFGFATGGNRIS